MSNRVLFWGKWIKFFNRQPVLFHLAAAAGLFAGVTYLDWSLPREVSFSYFYLIPIVYLNWIFGQAVGCAASLAGASLWLTADLRGGNNHSYPLIPYWNAGLRFAVFLTVSLFFSRLVKEINQQLHLNTQLARKNRHVARIADIKSEFTSMVSHELRTPLTAVKENLAIVYDGSAGKVTEEQKDFLGIVKDNVERLIRVLNDILDFQRLESGSIPFRFDRGNLNDLAALVQKEFRPVALKRGLEIRAVLEPDLPDVLLDSDRINQVLCNLVQNAINYGGNAGAILLRTWSDGESISCTVEDHGRGILPEEIPKLFHSFQRLSSSGGTGIAGAGLGLAICKGIIDAHGGKIQVSSVPSQGTVFQISLKPLCETEFNNGPNRYR